MTNPARATPCASPWPAGLGADLLIECDRAARHTGAHSSSVSNMTWSGVPTREEWPLTEHLRTARRLSSAGPSGCRNCEDIDIPSCLTHLGKNRSLVDDLPDGRYWDGTYDWDKDGDDWSALRAPSGMPSRPDLEGLHTVTMVREPVATAGSMTAPTSDDPITVLQANLMATWTRVDPTSGVGRWPGAYAETFRALAEAALAGSATAAAL